MAKDRVYYFIDINLISKQIVHYGESDTATHTGNTDDPTVHRIFISKGQYNKLTSKLKQFKT